MLNVFNQLNYLADKLNTWSVVAPSGERLRVFVVLKLRDPYLSASEVSFSQWGAIVINLGYLSFLFFKM